MSTTWAPTESTTSWTTTTTSVATTTAESTTVDHDALGWDRSCKVTGELFFEEFLKHNLKLKFWNLNFGTYILELEFWN